MQQTDKYKLNLIERDDAFSPDALNENTRKVEDTLTAHAEAVAGQVAALDTRVTVLEGFKIATGTFTILENQETTVRLGFTPMAVYIRHNDFHRYNYHAFAITDGPTGVMWIEADGFTAKYASGTGNPYFDKGLYYYIAFGANQ